MIKKLIKQLSLFIKINLNNYTTHQKLLLNFQYIHNDILPLQECIKDIPKKYKLYAMKKAHYYAIRGHKISYIIKHLNYYKHFGIKKET